MVDIDPPYELSPSLISQRSQSSTYCIVLSDRVDARSLFTALEGGAWGYLLITTPNTTVLWAIGKHQAVTPLSPSVIAKLVGHFHKPVTCKKPPLSKRETEVFILIARD